MKSILKIYHRYVLTACMLVILWVLINLTVFFAFSFSQVVGKEGVVKWRGKHYQEIADALTLGDNGYEMGETGMARLLENGSAFCLLLNETGKVIWEWQKPAEVPKQFSAGDIAAFSKWYLKDYPVNVWRYGEGGLLVFGYPKGSLVQYHFSFRIEELQRDFAYIQVFIISNLLLLFVLALLFGHRFYRSLKPVGEGIEALAKGQSVRLKEKGMTQYLRERINQTSALLEEQRTELARRDMARTEWIAGVSHDIRTPLSLIAGYADELAGDGKLPEEARQKAKTIRTQSFSIKKLIEDLNLTSKLTYHMQPLRNECYVPAVWLRSTAAMMINGGEIPDNCELDIDVDPLLEQKRLTGDVQLLTRALQNLLGNSVRHNPGGCHIWLTARPAEEGFCFCVEDRGKGVPKIVQDMLKEEKSGSDAGEKGRLREERGRNNRPQEMGAMSDKKPHVMGLRVVKQIAAAHGGQLWFEEDGRRVWLSVKDQKE